MARKPISDKHAIPEGEAKSDLADYPLVKTERDKDLEPGFLYVIGPKKRKASFKVGYGTSVSMRRSHLQTGSPDEYHIFDEVEFAELRDAREAEKRVHEALKAYHVRGEWFRAPLDTICKAINHEFAERKNIAKMLLRKIDERNCERYGVSKIEISRLREAAYGGR